MPFTVSGVDAFSSKLMSIAGRVKDEVGDELEDIGDDLKERSQTRVSVRTGALRDSAYSRVDRSGDDLGLEVGYEGLPYIIPHHEGYWRNFLGRYGPLEMDYPGGGEAKWFEKSWLEGKPRDMQRVRSAVDRALKR